MTTFHAQSTAGWTQRLIRALPGALLVALMLVGAAIPEHAAADGTSTLIRVGAGSPIKSIAEAARRAVDGATIEVDAGEYRADVAVWSRLSS